MSVRFEHLYIHVPFCARRCVYCDFAIAVRRQVPVAEFLRALEAEWDVRHSGTVFALDTLYLGGGTPSKLGGDGVARLLDLVRRRASFAPDAEVTVEANPEDVNADAVRTWRAAGVNRLSLGVQSFDDSVLRWMHRTHDAAAARRAVTIAREEGMNNLSVDLIFATPAIVPRDWARDLDAVVDLRVPHLSVYGLTVEAHTPLGRWVAREDATEAPDERFEGEFLLAHETLTRAGYTHYEVSNFAAPGHHARHNLAYWRRAPYAGMGPSAHEFDGRERRWNLPAYSTWATAASQRRDPLHGRERLDDSQARSESVYLGLRTEAGVNLGDGMGGIAASWIGAGWAVPVGDAVRLTASGWLRLDALATVLTPFRNHC